MSRRHWRPRQHPNRARAGLSLACHSFVQGDFRPCDHEAGSRTGFCRSKEHQLEFQSFNFRNRFIRHRNFEGILSLKQDGGPGADFSFVLESRGPGLVALRSTNFPDHFLRHANFRIFLGKSSGPGDHLFTLDSTFFMEQGLAEAASEWVSFRSVNFPDRYLRHRNFKLFLEPKDSPNLMADATFFKIQPIDTGTALNPADE